MKKKLIPSAFFDFGKAAGPLAVRAYPQVGLAIGNFGASVALDSLSGMTISASRWLQRRDKKVDVKITVVNTLNFVSNSALYAAGTSLEVAGIVPAVVSMGVYTGWMGLVTMPTYAAVRLLSKDTTTATAQKWAERVQKPAEWLFRLAVKPWQWGRRLAAFSQVGRSHVLPRGIIGSAVDVLLTREVTEDDLPPKSPSWVDCENECPDQKFPYYTCTRRRGHEGMHAHLGVFWDARTGQLIDSTPSEDEELALAKDTVERAEAASEELNRAADELRLNVFDKRTREQLAAAVGRELVGEVALDAEPSQAEIRIDIHKVSANPTQAGKDLYWDYADLFKTSGLTPRAFREELMEHLAAAGVLGTTAKRVQAGFDAASVRGIH